MNQFHFNITTDEGNKLESPLSYLFTKRHIFCFGEINPENSLNIITQIEALCIENSLDPINIHIDSPGGVISSGLAIYDAMQNCPCQINTICHSNASSIASILFLAGKERTVYEHSTILLHNPFVSTCNGNASKIKDTVDTLLRTQEEIILIYMRHTGLSKKEISELLDNEIQLSSQEALEKGFATKILKIKENNGENN